MKRRKLIKTLEKNGWWFARHGDRHDIYTNGKRTEAVPRHVEIDEYTAKGILKRNGLK